MAHEFINYSQQFGEIKTKALFGAVGVFCDGVAFALIARDKIYIAGGEDFDQELRDLGCERYQQFKKTGYFATNYYDISQFYRLGSPQLNVLIKHSIQLAKERRVLRDNRQRLRDLPNMHFTLERMLKKVGIDNVACFMSLSSEEVFEQIQNHYGNSVDINLLWKFAGAKEGYHWTQITPSRKEQLLSRMSL